MFPQPVFTLSERIGTDLPLYPGDEVSPYEWNEDSVASTVIDYDPVYTENDLDGWETDSVSST